MSLPRPQLKRRRKKKPENQTGPQFVAEPVDVRVMSFVGTHEYLAPEIVFGEGHGRGWISQLLAKDPARRLGSTMGASAIKHHSFFQGVNWALLRCTKPPFVPPPFNISSREVVSDDSCPDTPVDYF
ncbi:serine/threonine-protein kinase D6PKL2 [Tanacetum coccineum]